MPDSLLSSILLAVVAAPSAPAAPSRAATAAHSLLSDPAWGSLAPLVFGSVLNLVVALIVVRFIYYPVTRDRSYVFSFLAFNTVIFFVLCLLSSTQLSVGVGFGLFAIFSVLRYRTDAMPIREMTYLFVVIALPVMNSVMVSGGNYQQLAYANAVVIGVIFALERQWGFRFQGRKTLIYERMDLIPPARRADLLADLRKRTGLPITRVEVGLIDFLKDTAELTIYYEENDPATYASVSPTELPKVMSPTRSMGNAPSNETVKAS